ncbi:hypothetical protein, partial [Escherichia coli]|uniref:hypothetical protein n=1 Tax=Escherichia coli TaxID=562 RepID=UPI000E354222
KLAASPKIIHKFTHHLNSPVSALFSLFFKQLEVNPLQSIVILNQINENRCCHISDILFLYDI